MLEMPTEQSATHEKSGRTLSIGDILLQTSFSLYLRNQWTNFYKLSCAGKPQMRVIHICVGCTKATTNN